MGKVGNRTVEPAQTTERRSAAKGPAGLFKRLLERLTPGASRAESQFRKAVRSTDAHFAKLLEAMSETARHTEVPGILGKLEKNTRSAPLRNHAHDAIVQKHAHKHFKAMDEKGLKEVMKGLSEYAGTPIPGDVASLRHAANVELVRRHPMAVELMSDQDLDGVCLAVDLLQDPLVDAGLKLIKHSALSGIHNPLVDRTSAGNQKIPLENLSPADLKDLESAVESLNEVRHEGHPDTGTPDLGKWDKEIQAEVDNRAGRQEAAFAAAASKLVAYAGDSRIPSLRLAGEIIEAAKCLQEMQEHDTNFDKPLRDQTDLTLKLLQANLPNLLGKLEPAKLPNAELHALNLALRELDDGNRGANSAFKKADAAIDNEIRKRMQHCQDRHSEALNAAFLAASKADYNKVLTQLDQAARLADEATRVHQELGVPLETEAERKTFRTDSLNQNAPIGADGNLGRVDLKGFLNSDDGIALQRLIKKEGQAMLLNPSSQEADALLAARLLRVARSMDELLPPSNGLRQRPEMRDDSAAAQTAQALFADALGELRSQTR